MFFAFAMFVFAFTMAKTLKNELHSLNKMASDKNSRRDMYKKLGEFRELHANIKQLSILSI